MNLTQQLKTWYQSHFNKNSKVYQARVIARAIESEQFSPSFSTILYTGALVPLALVGCKNSYEPVQQQTKETIADLCADFADKCDADIKDVCNKTFENAKDGGYQQEKLTGILKLVAKGEKIDNSTIKQFLIVYNRLYNGPYYDHTRIEDDDLCLEFANFIYRKYDRQLLSMCNIYRAINDGFDMKRSQGEIRLPSEVGDKCREELN